MSSAYLEDHQVLDLGYLYLWSLAFLFFFPFSLWNLLLATKKTFHLCNPANRKASGLVLEKSH